MSETGIIPNIEHFTVLKNFCTSLTTRYNPSNSRLLLTNISDILSDANDAVDTVTQLANPRSNVISARIVLFEQLPTYATRIVGAFKISENITQSNVDHAKHFLRKIRGERKSKKLINPSPEDPKQISASQRSYFNQAEFFKDLISFILGLPGYAPNETDLKEAALNAFADSLDAANQAALEANTPWLNAIAARDLVLYAPQTGLVDIALDVKQYIRTIKEVTPEEYAQISGLKFTRPKKIV